MTKRARERRLFTLTLKGDGSWASLRRPAVIPTHTLSHSRVRRPLHNLGCPFALRHSKGNGQLWLCLEY